MKPKGIAIIASDHIEGGKLLPVDYLASMPRGSLRGHAVHRQFS
jgi:hypothetical protein